MTKSCILLVDDENSNRVLLREMLQDDYVVLDAHNGSSMWGILASHPVDLILLDVMMPEEDGFSLGKKIMENPQYHHIPIMYVTAKVTADDVSEGYKSGAYDYIKKPFNIIELSTRIQHVLERAKQTHTLKKKAITADMVFECIDDAIIITDSDFVIQNMNPACISLFGQAEQELLHHCLADLLYDSNQHAIAIHSLLQTPASVWIQDAGGEAIPISITIRPVTDEHDSEIGWVSVLRDIRVQKEIEDTLLQAKLDAEEASKIKSEFLASMTHEIRTPLNAILGFSDLLQEEECNAETQKKFLDIIQKNGEKLQSFIENLLDISALEAQKIHIKKSLCNVHDLFSDLQHEFEIILPRYSGDKVHMHCLPQVPKDFAFLTDRNRLHQTLYNLLENACKFTPEGEIIFGCSLSKDSAHIEFFVTDTGIGIEKDQQKNIFTAFQKVKDAKIQYSSGIGLGLSISKNLTHLLGGQLTVESKISVGTTCNLVFPLDNRQ